MGHKRVLILIPTFYPIIGGSETLVWQIIHNISRANTRFMVVTKRLQGLAPTDSLGETIIYRLPTWGDGKFSALVFAVLSFLFLWRHRCEYDLIHVKPAWLHSLSALLAGKAFGKKVIIHFGGNELEGWPKSIAMPIRVAAQRRWADRLIALTPAMYRRLVARGMPQKKITLIPNGIDTQRFHPASLAEKEKLKRELGIPQGHVILYMGRFARQKNLEFLVEAFYHCAFLMRGPIYLLLVGDGPEKEKIKARIRQRHLEEKALLYAPTLDVVPYYRSADIFALPSHWEGHPIALLEAMSCGLAPVVSAIPGASETVTNRENGFVLPLDDANKWGRQLSQLLTNGGLRENLGRNARQKILEQYSIERFAGQILTVYNSLPR